MTAKLAEVASYCHSVAVGTPGLSLAASVREFLARYSRHPVNLTAGYYAQYTAVKDWDRIMTDLWKCIPAVSDPTQVYPELLCYDYTDLMSMILSCLGVASRPIRAVAGNPATTLNGYPMYLDHTFLEVWMGTKWSAQDAFYNVEYLLDQYTFASADDLCGAADLNDIIVRNRSTTGWVATGAHVLASQDFFAAIEHREDAGNSVVIMNGNRADFGRLFCVSSASTPRALRDLIISSVNHPIPTVVEIKSPPQP